MKNCIAIAGGGIGGLAAALRCAKADLQVQLFERAAAITEVGAGIQIGPNVTRILQAWSLGPALQAVADFPAKLQVRQALTGQDTGQLRWGEQAVARYGAPYATIHRADLHQLLLDAVKAQGSVSLHLNRGVTGYSTQDNGLRLDLDEGAPLTVQALIGADGLWSRVRAQLLGDGPARFSGHLAYRAMLKQSDLPAALRSQVVTVWMGPHLHVVQYPVRRGELMNVVAIVHGPAPQDLSSWDHSANAADLKRALGCVCTALQALIDAVPAWRLWPLCDRPPMGSATEHAQGRVALLGDAAHPMRPFMAQGAGMAIEDAEALGRCLVQPGQDLPAQLANYAQQRWQRNARVQHRAIRNGQIFHATGWLRWGRDAATRLWGERLLDVPWLYNGPGARATEP
jgi:salicylate hydroxylase